MCLSPQSARLRSDLHEETKTCFRGIPCTPSPLPLSFSLSLSFLRSSSLSALPRGAHTLRVRGVRTRRKEELAQRDSPRSTLHFTMAKILCKAFACTHARYEISCSFEESGDGLFQTIRSIVFSNSFFLVQDGFLNRGFFFLFLIAFKRLGLFFASRMDLIRMIKFFD